MPNVAGRVSLHGEQKRANTRANVTLCIQSINLSMKRDRPQADKS
ncbi:MAG: hypothetical protein AAFY33_00620 [Cyanobacteria bacterium J06643_4]